MTPFQHFMDKWGKAQKRRDDGEPSYIQQIMPAPPGALVALAGMDDDKAPHLMVHTVVALALVIDYYGMQRVEPICDGMGEDGIIEGAWHLSNDSYYFRDAKALKRFAAGANEGELVYKIYWYGILDEGAV